MLEPQTEGLDIVRTETVDAFILDQDGKYRKKQWIKLIDLKHAG